MGNGKFVISLDFELYWGVRDSKSLNSYKSHILGVQTVIPKLLSMFDDYQIKSSFAIVGFLFYHNKNELLANIPKIFPQYNDLSLSPYLNHFDDIENDAITQQCYFAPELIQCIKNKPQHEIGTHTFSHYYCLEPGQNTLEFSNDLDAAIKIATEYQINLTSIVFPRNQYSMDYLKICKAAGLKCYRGNPNHWMYQADIGNRSHWIKRGMRLLDAYLNISGHHCFLDLNKGNETLIDIPASRFLRPYDPMLKWFEFIRLNRILSSMTHAAINNLTYHLWWHPHNFGIHQDANFKFLESILQHYQYLNNTYHFTSCTMTECANSQY